VLALAALLVASSAIVFELARARLAVDRAQAAADTAAVSAGRRLRELLGAASAHDREARADWRPALALAAEPAAATGGARIVAVRLGPAGAWPPTEVEVRVVADGPFGIRAPAVARAALVPEASAPVLAAPAHGAPTPATGGGAPVWVPERYRALTERAAADAGIPAAMLAAVLQVESGWDPSALSDAGAMGIAEFTPTTAAAVGLADPLDPAQAIPAAARLLAAHRRAFGSWALALAAYNAGPDAVRRAGGVPPFRETWSYVVRVLALAGGGDRGPAPGGVVLVPAGDALT
jgi:soluble lytic murein transglycosylase-like protein